MSKQRSSCAIELPAGASLPAWIQLMPAGDVQARDGRNWRLDDADTVIESTLARSGNTDIVIDYEHQTDLIVKNGQPAPAAGWIQSLENRDGAIWGQVKWTDRAAAQIKQREYRYLSPTFLHDKANKVLLILRAALTNSPALEMPALAKTNEDNAMNKKRIDKILTALKLDETSPEQDIDKAIARLAEKAESAALARVAKAIGLKADAETDAIVARATSLSKQKEADIDTGAFVPRSEFDEVSKQLATMQKDAVETKATAAVDAAISAGKITPAQRDWAMAYARKDAAGFTAYTKDAPVILAPGETGAGNAPSGDAEAALTEVEKAVCKAMNITHEKFKESKQQETAA